MADGMSCGAFWGQESAVVMEVLPGNRSPAYWGQLPAETQTVAARIALRDRVVGTQSRGYCLI
jgi:hypothetical protein